MEPGEVRTWNSQKVERCCYADLIANFSKENEQNNLIEVLTMDMPADEVYEKVMRSGIYEKGLEQGLEQGEINTRRDNVLALFEFGMSAKKISQALKLDLVIVNEILSLNG